MAWCRPSISSGKRIKRGEITRTGNAAARTMLIESAWHYRFSAREGRSQVRLCVKFRRTCRARKADSQGRGCRRA
ncbi:transposase [Rhizobium mongolense]